MPLRSRCRAATLAHDARAVHPAGPTENATNEGFVCDWVVANMREYARLELERLGRYVDAALPGWWRTATHQKLASRRAKLLTR